eukprot:m.924019 g.924019  ORF g.924019 m.924019 type:complete len:468 (+) comp116546_c0_seq1:367-1770(+)
MAACSQKVPTGPSTATRCGDSSARQADMISRQMAATCSPFRGPGLAARILSMTWATRSGRKKGVPSARLISPTCSATRARWFSSSSSCLSRPSIWPRKASSSWEATGSTMAGLEVLQEGHQRLHAFQRHRVVDRRAHAAHRLVALELQQPGGLGLGKEALVELLVLQEEGHVHARAAVGIHAVLVEARRIQCRVEQAGFVDVALLDGRQATLAGVFQALDPLEDQTSDVDREGRRRVVHGLRGRHGLVVEGRRADVQRVAEQVFAHEHQRQACGADVLLRTAEGQADAAPIDGARQQMGRAVDDQWYVTANARQIVELDAVDGLVRADVDVGSVIAQLPFTRNLAAVALCGDLDIGIAARLGRALTRPGAGDDDIDLAAAAQVQRHDGVFTQPATLHEQDAEVARHCQQLSQISFGRLGNGDELLAAVAHLHDAHAAALPVQHLGRHLAQYGLGQGGGAGGKVERAG